ncbi:bifunctional [glutamate--ammonia ligase]-adenylyl-L-tyrosine phosphorylase/[glutamate--ammonia-ligase] adenylyltransferase [Glaciimonas sp. CA11.2]|uniref:bifunctional [glutamate--ammonia ligase]-adenylyl-L-tyrosine phosphorylase/[glutamate--ammonia-ligase] adenylyltransferase n=1 Tax=Glaciimonas sp. CA11.2 TaxID=3048601 RepID=UPI002AB47648|nr:bifunctional [glutamate--ammonia ligase]-adenylyl-L-tyrosine phosphorylase/[glutamate--ammonia-ligase] adenylyltransferase [Glaciimonas sp. CA11.2]MDY7547396.1 bifunctional [glutamate--ammonia ligase]-adenylyl-L-tyrosine phosphorylase/[glutamate--ammonia-ligase] adenylyltransferase [Glaciimonas sp. CA11.2]MEB0164253.1 bifunctional [glutamate--ammonia ligase]-adenylyl-L-tyrosine phosphorylase/[glutamate--ammonia-ligase] adenylyltransferase [Glaciimonas sp. CA11.2]
MSNAVTQSLISTDAASHFYTRWISAEAGRAEKVAGLAQLSLSQTPFALLLQNEIDSGMPLPRAMRRLRNLIVCTLIARDITGVADLEEVVTTMTVFADFAVKTHLASVMSEMVGLHGMPIGKESGLPQELIILGMGKLGGGELNVSSDIDLIFVYAEDGDTVTDSTEQRPLSNHEFFIRLGKKLITAISEITQDGFTFRVDMALRPNGASGPLVASLNMVENYLVTQGREWERYAWCKARAMTGRPEDIVALESISRPFVFRRYLDYGTIDAMRLMHRQIRAEVTRQEALHPDRNNNVKLGRGGIREIEFLAQVFQLIRGGREHDLRDRSTRKTLRTLVDKNLLTAEVVDQLLEAYDFLRNLEHRLQYLDDAQTHTLPVSDAERLIIAQSMGFGDTETLLNELEKRRVLVAAQFDAIFSDKQDKQNKQNGQHNAANNEAQNILCALSDRDSVDVIESVLTSLGFGDVTDNARRLASSWQSGRIQNLPEISRNRYTALINVALPIIGKLSESKNSTESTSQHITLGRLLDFLDTIARRAAYLALLTEYPGTLLRVIRMIGASDWAAKFLTLHPILLDELLDDRSLHDDPDWPQFAQDCRRQMDAVAGDTERQLDLLRELHHAQLFRLLAQDLEGKLSVEVLSDYLSLLADILVDTTIQSVWKTFPNRHREVPKFAVIAYGKLGGKELSYASDLDVVFLYDDADQDAPALYAKLAQRFITWMTSHTSAGILFDIDIALRPDGASGLLVSTFATFEKYQRQSAWLWEHQALTRARFCSGDSDIGERFEALRVDVLRQVRDPLKLEQEVRAMRQKMRDANRNRSDLFDLKHDEGGMIDIEFLVQFLILRHSALHPELTADIGNIALLKLCGELGLIDAELASEAANAYRHYRKLQHQRRLQGDERARVSPDWVAAETPIVKKLLASVFTAATH